VSKSEKKYHFIYKTTCLITKKYYIGMHSTDNLEDGYMGSGKALKFSIKRYGKENHRVEILEMVESRELLAEREKAIVTISKVRNGKCMNLKVGGIGGFTKKAKKKKTKKKPIAKKTKPKTRLKRKK
jgi:PHP family Zn ribbon phosphoesterase